MADASAKPETTDVRTVRLRDLAEAALLEDHIHSLSNRAYSGYQLVVPKARYEFFRGCSPAAIVRMIDGLLDAQKRLQGAGMLGDETDPVNAAAWELEWDE